MNQGEMLALHDEALLLRQFHLNCRKRWRLGAGSDKDDLIGLAEQSSGTRVIRDICRQDEKFELLFQLV